MKQKIRKAKIIFLCLLKKEEEKKNEEIIENNNVYLFYYQEKKKKMLRILGNVIVEDKIISNNINEISKEEIEEEIHLTSFSFEKKNLIQIYQNCPKNF